MKLLRILLLAAVALAVPFQGALAVSAAQCMAMQHHDAAPTDAHDHGDGHADGHGDDQPKSAHCGPCVACCAAAAIAASYDGVSLPEAPSASVASVAPPSFSGVPPDSLDRPPLSL